MGQVIFAGVVSKANGNVIALPIRSTVGSLFSKFSKSQLLGGGGRGREGQKGVVEWRSLKDYAKTRKKR